MEYPIISGSRAAISIAVVLVCALSAFALDFYGKSNRLYASSTAESLIDSTESAYRLWERENVRGRTLLLFGSYPHITRSSDYEGIRELGPSNFIEFAAFNNYVRRIYYIVPDESWESITQQGATGALRRAYGMERGMYLYNLIGIPIIATTPTSLPRLSETALVYVNASQFDYVYVKEILLAKSITADIIVTYGGI